MKRFVCLFVILLPFILVVGCGSTEKTTEKKSVELVQPSGCLFGVSVRGLGNSYGPCIFCLNHGHVTPALREDFRSNGYPLSDNLSVDVRIKDKEWVIKDHGNKKAYLLVVSDDGQWILVNPTEYTPDVVVGPPATGLGDLESKCMEFSRSQDQRISDLERQIAQLKAQTPGSPVVTGGGLRLEHSAPPTAMPNSIVPGTIKVINPNHYPVYTIAVYCYLAQGLDFVSASDGGQYDGASRTIVWRMDKLEAQGTKVLTYEVKVAGPGTYEICVWATSETRECVITKVVQPMLTCELNAPPQAMTNKPFDLCIVIKNTGDGPAPDVMTMIRLSESLLFEDGTPEKSWNGGTVNAGSSIQQCWKVKATNVGRCNIQANVSGGGGNVTTNCAAVVEIVTPDLAITKSAPPLAHLGREFTYKIEVSNTGNAQATDVVLVDHLPEGVEFKEASEAGRYNDPNRSVEWSLGTLRPGESRSFTIRVKAMRENMNPGWKNTAKVTCAEGIVRDAEAVTIVEAVPAMHNDSYDTEDPVQVGDTTVYVITIRNEGQKDATQVGMKIKIPEQSSFVSLEAATGVEAGNVKIEGQWDASSGMAIFQPIPVMHPGDSAVYKVQVRAETVGDAVNTAILTFAEFTKEVIVQEPTKYYK